MIKKTTACTLKGEMKLQLKQYIQWLRLPTFDQNQIMAPAPDQLMKHRNMNANINTY